jgi:hypothetical protein
MINARRVYSLPPAVAGTATVGGATHVDVTRFVWDGHYYAHIRAGTVIAEPPEFVPLRVLGATVERDMTISDVAGFEAHIAASEEYGVSVPDGHPSFTMGAALEWMLAEWLDTASS